MIDSRDTARIFRLSLALVAGLTASACGEDTTGGKDSDTDAQASGGSIGGGLGDMGPSGGSTGGAAGGSTGGATGGSEGGSGGSPTGGAGGGGDKPDSGLGGAGGEPVGGSGGSGGVPVGGAGGSGGSGGSPVGGAGGEMPVGGQPAPGGEQPPPPVPDGDYAYSRIVTAAIANAGEPSCPDFNGGGPDNAFAGLGAIANGQLQTAIDDNSLNLLPVSIGLPAGAADGQFAIAVLTGTDNVPNIYDVNPNSLDENGDPLILFNPANANGGSLQAGPGNFTLGLPVQGVEVVLHLTEASITGNIAVDNNAGLSIRGGTIAGQITQEDLDAALVVVPPEFVGLIPIFLHPDLDTNGDGVIDGYSLCLTFEATPANVQGFPVP